MKVFVFIIGFLLLIVSIAQAFNDRYQCSAVTETTVGYAPASNKVETGGGSVKKP